MNWYEKYKINRKRKKNENKFRKHTENEWNSVRIFTKPTEWNWMVDRTRTTENDEINTKERKMQFCTHRTKNMKKRREWMKEFHTFRPAVCWCFGLGQCSLHFKWHPPLSVLLHWCTEMIFFCLILFLLIFFLYVGAPVIFRQSKWWIIKWGNSKQWTKR